MIPGMNPRDMQKAMKRLGIQQQEIDAVEVVIKLHDKDLVVSSPSVAKVNMMGQETFQISGVVHERPHSSEPDISAEDIEAVVQQTGVSRDQAVAAVKRHHGDLAAAILELQE
jgi:nascent polypeptide-associated complex subunit alpha